jgi:thymidine kinase
MKKEFKLYTGCMFAGKSNQLKQEILKAKEKDLTCLIVKPATDTRDKNNIVLHNGEKIKANPIQNHSNLIQTYFQYVRENNNFPDVVCADEIQFFDAPSIDFLITLYEKDCSNIIATGLNKNFLGAYFEFNTKNHKDNIIKIKDMKDLIEYASKVIELKADCSHCGTKKSAEYSFYNNLAIKGKQKEIIVIGGKDTYQPLCKDCYVKAMNKKGYGVE